jgi:hypothetical protein
MLEIKRRHSMERVYSDLKLPIFMHTITRWLYNMASRENSLDNMLKDTEMLIFQGVLRSIFEEPCLLDNSDRWLEEFLAIKSMSISYDTNLVLWLDNISGTTHSEIRNPDPTTYH